MNAASMQYFRAVLSARLQITRRFGISGALTW